MLFASFPSSLLASAQTLFLSSILSWSFLFVFLRKFNPSLKLLPTSSTFSSPAPSPSTDGKKYRYVALDLDGTTLNSNHQLSPRTISTIARLNSQGIHFLIATGRTSASVHPVVQALNLTQPVTPAVCFNGACAVEISAEFGIRSTIFESFLSASATDKLLKFALDRALCAQYYNAETGAVYASPQNPTHQSLLDRYAHLTGKRQLCVADYDHPKSLSPPAKVLLLVEEHLADDLLAEARAFFGPNEFHIVRGSPSPFFIEFLAPSTNKGSGMRILCERLRIPLDAVVSFGDGENDEEFLRYAGLGVAMKNARPLAMAAANLTLEWTNDEDGVARQLERMETQGWLDTDSNTKRRTSRDGDLK
jgi:Cof subfamily protein (haloacid dehalogenase superfamily)